MFSKHKLLVETYLKWFEEQMCAAQYQINYDKLNFMLFFDYSEQMSEGGAPFLKFQGSEPMR